MTMQTDRRCIPFASVSDIARLVHQLGIDDFLRGLAQAIEQDFRRWPLFDKTPRLASHSGEGVIELMPTSDGELYSFKYVNGHPSNPARGLQTVTAFGVLADVATGYPLMLSEMTLLTALRTAATSALVARHLARPEARTMALIGNGAQSEFQALAFAAIAGIRSLRLFDIDPRATDRLMRNLRGTGLELRSCHSAEEAVLGAEIITTVTADKRNAVILSDNMVGAGVHVNAVGGDCPGKTELHPDILRRAAIFVEYPPQTRIEGEIQQLPADHPVTELSALFSGKAAGRTDARQITVFDSVGFAVEDFATLRHVWDMSGHGRLFQQVELLTAPADPRDLYGVLGSGSVDLAVSA